VLPAQLGQLVFKEHRDRLVRQAYKVRRARLGQLVSREHRDRLVRQAYKVRQDQLEQLVFKEPAVFRVLAVAQVLPELPEQF
jgi:hypothetical protein